MRMGLKRVNGGEVVLRFAKWVRPAAAAGLLLAASAGVSACGFQPLYAQAGVVSNLAAVDVVAPQGRAGFLIREHLDDALARNRDTAPAYRMNLTLHETRYPRGVRIDNVATRYEYVLTANYVLNRLPSGAVAKRGLVRVELTYDSADQPYAAITAQQDAEDRAAEEAARRIQLELAAWLATGAKS
ncbi:MAG: putative secreted (periplasmic) protein [Phenylobacterium sp.]|nr:putative secreted (periplasmic) protein [Phenylobacterium sp.]